METYIFGLCLLIGFIPFGDCLFMFNFPTMDDLWVLVHATHVFVVNLLAGFAPFGDCLLFFNPSL